MTATTKTVADDTARLLERYELISPAVNNRRRISMTALTPPETTPKKRENSHSSDEVITSESFAATHVNERTAFIEVPAVLESMETYIFIGFDNATARRVWARYSNYVKNADPDDTEGKFMDFARWQVENVRFADATSETDDWLGYMKAIGVSEELQNVIMLPEFSDLRYTASCSFWLLDTMETRYESLQGLDARLRAQAARIKDMSKTTSRLAGSAACESNESSQ